MKKHLFYSVLAVFIATSVVTLMGVTGSIAIPEKYLDKLIWAFLVQLAAAVFSLFRRADFFSDDEKKRLESVEVAVSQTLSAPKEILSPIPSQTGKGEAGQSAEIDAPAYFEKLARLNERPLERDTWLRDLNGKQVNWRGIFADIRLSATEGAQIQLNPDSSKHSIFFVFVPPSLRDTAYSFQKGDRLIVRGVINCALMPSSPMISATAVERSDLT